MRFIGDFCSRDWPPAALLEYVSPQAVKAGDRTLPAGLPWWTSNGVVTSVYTATLHRGVVWWLDPPADRPWIAEVHLVPAVSPVRYAGFVEAFRWTGELGREQDGPLSDIVHRFPYTCGERTLEVRLHEVVWAGDAVGRLGQIGLVRR